MGLWPLPEPTPAVARSNREQTAVSLINSAGSAAREATTPLCGRGPRGTAATVRPASGDRRLIDTH